MAKHQTRRSISVNAAEYERAVAAATKAGVPLSKFTEQALRDLDARALTPAEFAIRSVMTDDLEIPPVRVVTVEERTWPSPPVPSARAPIAELTKLAMAEVLGDADAVVYSTGTDDEPADQPDVQVVYDEDR